MKAPTAHSTQNAQALLARLSVRDRLSAEEEQLIGDLVSGPLTIHEQNSDIVREGERPRASVLVVSGLAARVKLVGDGRRQITAFHLAGDFVDLHSFLLKRQDHGVQAISTCRTVEVAHSRLLTVTETHPHLTRMLWLLTLMDGAIHREWLASMGRRTAEAHLAHLICEFYVRLDEIGQTRGASFRLGISQNQLADALGLSAVHVNRMLQQLRSKGLISWIDQTVSILDWDRLKQEAEFDDNYLNRVSEPR
jgi:CRP-like cAMP-binding protein